MLVIPAKAYCCPGKISADLAKRLNLRHPSESWDPVTYKTSKALDSSFRWNDEFSGIELTRNFLHPGSMRRAFLLPSIYPGQQWAKAGMTSMGFWR